MKNNCYSFNKRITFIRTCVNNSGIVGIGEESSADAEEVLTTVWADVKTKDSTAWHQVNSTDSITHVFTIRYSSEVQSYVDASNIIRYQDNNYNVVKFNNIDEENKYIKISCTYRDKKVAS